MQDLKRWDPAVKILMLTAHAEDHYAVRCLQAGADGYLTKEHAARTLTAAILKIYLGGKYITASLAEQLVLELSGGVQKKPHEELSEREFQVLRLLGSGKTVTEIAETLDLSVKTVSTYRSRVLEKMNLHSTADIIRYAVEERLAS